MSQERVFAHRLSGIAGLLCLLLALGACVSAPLPTAQPAAAPATTAPPTTAVEAPTPAPSTPASASFDDPFAYCQAVGTIDAPDARYTGAKLPDAIANGLNKAMGMEGTPSPIILNTSSWRCMGGKVFACTVGANLPCGEKVNLDKTPSPEIVEFCKVQPQSDFVPMVVTGRATAYSWKCKDGAPAIDQQIAEPDAEGFVKDIWYEIQP